MSITPGTRTAAERAISLLGKIDQDLFEHVSTARLRRRPRLARAGRGHLAAAEPLEGRLLFAAPVAVDDSMVTTVDTAVSQNLLTNDYDDDGDPLSVTNLHAASHGTAAYVGGGNFQYTPNSGFVGTDTFEYRISDGTSTDWATVTVTVNANANNPPAAQDDALTVKQDPDYPATASLLANDTDPDGDGLWVHGVDWVSQQGGAVNYEGGGVFSYQPAPGFVGTDSFTYQIRDRADPYDPECQVDTASVTVTVTENANAPVATSDSLVAYEDTPATANLLADDYDVDGDSLWLSGVTNGSHGTVSYDGGGQFTYTPQAGFTGYDFFQYTIRDRMDPTAPGCKSDTALVTVLVQNPPPDAVDDFVKTKQGQAVTIDVKANDCDPDGGKLSLTDWTQPSHGTVSKTWVKGVGGCFTYTPYACFAGGDSFTYEVTDDEGYTDWANVYITVSPDWTEGPILVVGGLEPMPWPPEPVLPEQVVVEPQPYYPLFPGPLVNIPLPWPTEKIAQLDVYLDSNANGRLGEFDNLLGTATCGQNGWHLGISMQDFVEGENLLLVKMVDTTGQTHVLGQAIDIEGTAFELL